MQETPQKFGSSVRRRILEGAFLSAADYLTAQRARAVLNSIRSAPTSPKSRFSPSLAPPAHPNPSKAWTPTEQNLRQFYRSVQSNRSAGDLGALWFQRRKFTGGNSIRRAGFPEVNLLPRCLPTSKRPNGTTLAGNVVGARFIPAHFQDLKIHLRQCRLQGTRSGEFDLQSDGSNRVRALSANRSTSISSTWVNRPPSTTTSPLTITVSRSPPVPAEDDLIGTHR